MSVVDLLVYLVVLDPFIIPCSDLMVDCSICVS